MPNTNLSDQSIWSSILLSFLICLALIAGGLLYYQTEAQRIRHEKHNRLAAIGKLKVERIQEWRNERLRQIEAFAKSPFVIAAAQGWLQDRGNLHLENQLQNALVIQKEIFSYNEMLLSDVSGHTILSTGLKTDTLNPREAEVIEMVLTYGSARLSDLFLTTSGVAQLASASPILDKNSQPVAVIIARINATDSLYPLVELWPTPSKTAETLLVRRDGDDVLFLNQLRHMRDTALSFKKPIKTRDLPAVHGVLGNQGIFQGKDYRGEEVLADLRPISDSTWFMVSKVDVNEILGDIPRHGAMIFIFVLLCMLLTASATASSYRYRQASFYRMSYQLEQERRHEHELFRTILYSIGDAIITFDKKGFIKQMNPVAEVLTGWNERDGKDESIERVFRIIDEQSRKSVGSISNLVWSNGPDKKIVNHKILISKNGEEHPVAITAAPVKGADDDMFGTALVFRDQSEERLAARQLADAHATLEQKVLQRTSELRSANEALLFEIHQRKQAEASLSMERRRFYDVMETLPIYIALLSSDYHVVFANRVFRERFGESGGRRCFEFLFHRSQPCENCETYKVATTANSHNWQWTGPDGRHYDIHDFPFTDSDGSFLILEMGIDITERKRAEDALKATLSDLRRSNSDLERFAYVSSHDLQEPLRTIVCTLQLLARSHKGKLGKESDELIEYAVDGAKKMKTMIQDLLVYSQLSTGECSHKEIDLGEVLEQSVKNMKALFLSEKAILTYDPMPKVHANPSQLLQVFQNLIQNAVKFGPVESCKVHVSAKRSENEWILSVRDNGMGIEKEYFDRIFVIFQQLSKTGSFAGTGMGLAIVKRIIERHGGRVWLESEIGIGSTFYFTIPIQDRVSQV
jgi:PAS domain S-box-containing protein